MILFLCKNKYSVDAEKYMPLWYTLIKNEPSSILLTWFNMRMKTMFNISASTVFSKQKNNDELSRLSDHDSGKFEDKI